MHKVKKSVFKCIHTIKLSILYSLQIYKEEIHAKFQFALILYAEAKNFEEMPNYINRI